MFWGKKLNTMCLYSMSTFEAFHSTEALHRYCSTHTPSCQHCTACYSTVNQSTAALQEYLTSYKTMVP